MSEFNASRDHAPSDGGVREPATAEELANDICLRWLGENGVAVGGLSTAIRVKMGISLFNAIVEVIAPALRAATASPAERPVTDPGMTTNGDSQ